MDLPAEGCLASIGLTSTRPVNKDMFLWFVSLGVVYVFSDLVRSVSLCSEDVVFYLTSGWLHVLHDIRVMEKHRVASLIFFAFFTSVGALGSWFTSVAVVVAVFLLSAASSLPLQPQQSSPSRK